MLEKRWRPCGSWAEPGVAGSVHRRLRPQPICSPADERAAPPLRRMGRQPCGPTALVGPGRHASLSRLREPPRSGARRGSVWYRVAPRPAAARGCRGCARARAPCRDADGACTRCRGSARDGRCARARASSPSARLAPRPAGAHQRGAGRADGRAARPRCGGRRSPRRARGDPVHRRPRCEDGRGAARGGAPGRTRGARRAGPRGAAQPHRRASGGGAARTIRSAAPRCATRGAGARRQRLGQDDHDRKARRTLPRGRSLGDPRRRGHLSRRRHRAAPDLG